MKFYLSDTASIEMGEEGDIIIDRVVRGPTPARSTMVLSAEEVIELTKIIKVLDKDRKN